MLDQKFISLMSVLEQDTDAVRSFEENPLPVLTTAGIPLVPVLQPPTIHNFNVAANAGASAAMVAAGATASARGISQAEQVTASTHWWGVDIVMNEKMTQDIIDAGMVFIHPLRN